MGSKPLPGGLLRLLLESLLVFSPGIVFLWTYARRFQAADGAVLQHATVVATALLLYAAIRFLIVAWGQGRRTGRFLSTLLASGVLLVVGTFYALQIAGLKFWGNLPTWSLVRAYLPLMSATIEQAQINPVAVSVAGALLVLAMAILIHVLLRRFGFAQPDLGREWRLGTMLLVGVAALLFQRQIDATLWSEERWSRSEPLYNFFRDVRARFVQGHMVSPVQLRELQRTEDEERRKLPIVAHRRNVVLIIVDALRAQNLKQYGYSRDTMPYFDQLASEVDSARIERTYSACNESTCGIIAIAASRFVHAIVPRMITMSEVLRASGYRNYYLVSGDHTNFYGLREFYGANDGYVDGTTQHQRHLNDDRNILEGLQRLPLSPEQPFLLHIHLKSTHALGIRFSDDTPYQPSENYTRLVMTGAPTDLDPTPFINYYDDGIRQTDAVIRRIVEHLRQRGVLDDTLLVLTGDHGESLGEGGKWSHANSVAENALHVPLTILSFGQPLSPTLHERRTAFQVDIAPTVLTELGAGVPATWQGTALQQAPVERLSFFSQGQAYGLYQAEPDGGVLKYWHDADGRHGLRFGPGQASGVALTESELRDNAVRWDTALVPVVAAISASPPICMSSTRNIALAEACSTR
jgi:glucan phosphoethanolaminetransferase (alkaline phosphatase superfamily)